MNSFQLMCSALLSLIVGVSSRATEAVTLHPASAMVRIGGAAASVPPKCNQYELEMVRGEHEGFQFAVLPQGTNVVTVDAVSIEADDKAPACELFRVFAVNHTNPRQDPMFKIPPRNLGWVPDVLVPLTGRDIPAKAISVQDGEVPLTYYVEFNSSGTPAGAHECRIKVRCGDSETTLVVFVQIKDVLLPTRASFRAATTWNWSLEKYYGRALSLEEKERFWRLCLAHRLTPCSFFSKAPDPSIEDVKRLNDESLSLVSLMQLSGREPRALTANEKQRYEPLLKQWREDLKAINRTSDAVVLLSDEPQVGSIDICRQNAAWIKEQFPELKIWCATRPAKSWHDFVDVFDTVTAHSTELYANHSHDEKALQELRATKPAAEYWWFHSVEPYAPFSNLRLDNALIEARVIGWQSCLYGVDGYEYFWISDWSENAASADEKWPDSAAHWKTGLSGAGTLIYPDENKAPLPSLRLVNLRDGLEDWALLEMLSPRAKGTPAEEIKPVTTGLDRFTLEPAVLQKARSGVIRKLLQK